MFYDNTIYFIFSIHHSSLLYIIIYTYFFLSWTFMDHKNSILRQQDDREAKRQFGDYFVCYTYMSSARARVTRVKASVRIQREVKMRELAKEVRESERMDERRPPPPAHRPSATQPILCHLKQKNNNDATYDILLNLNISIEIRGNIISCFVN